MKNKLEQYKVKHRRRLNCANLVDHAHYIIIKGVLMRKLATKREKMEDNKKGVSIVEILVVVYIVSPVTVP